MTRNAIEHKKRVGAFVAVTAMVCALVGAQKSARAAGPAATIDPIHGTPQSAAVNSVFQVRLVAYVRDAGTNGVPGLVVTFTAPASGSSATFGGSVVGTAVTDGSGVATAPILTANGEPGSFTLLATVAGLSATYNLTNTGGGGGNPPPPPPPLPPPPPVPTNLRLVDNLPPASVSVAGGAPQSAVVNGSFSVPLRATVRDAASYPLSGVFVTFTAPATGAFARFSGSATAGVVTDGNGVATAPMLTANGVTGPYAVTASVAGVAIPATFNVTNVATPPPPGSGWTNVTPAGFNYDPDYPMSQGNYGFMTVLADPARPSDLYTFTNYQGVWKSTDYGVTWTRINTGTNADAINAGRNWASVIDPNPSRNPATPPTLYTQTGYSTLSDNRRLGVWKSTDGGVNWTRVWQTILEPDGANITSLVGADVGGMTVDPANVQHVLVCSHGNTAGQAYDNHIFETTNGGQTWIHRGRPSGGGFVATNHYNPNFITSTAWITTSDGWGPDAIGSFVTNDSGATWTRVGPWGMSHNSTQIYVDPSGAAYLPAVDGIFRATAPYLSWTQVNSTQSSVVVGTPSYLYASYSFPSLGVSEPLLRRGLAGGGSFDPNYTPAPPAMTNGWSGAAVTRNPSNGKYIIVSANLLGGLWRYEE